MLTECRNLLIFLKKFYENMNKGPKELTNVSIAIIFIKLAAWENFMLFLSIFSIPSNGCRKSRTVFKVMSDDIQNKMP